MIFYNTSCVYAGSGPIASELLIQHLGYSARSHFSKMSLEETPVHVAADTIAKLRIIRLPDGT